MNANDIKTAFSMYLEKNNLKAGTKKAYTAQYWFLAGMRSTTKDGMLPPEIEVLPFVGRSIITEKGECSLCNLSVKHHHPLCPND